MEEMVPTELDTTFRKVLLWGNVHDPIAAMYGGVAGHAGLFSNATDLVKLMQMNLQGGTYGGDSYFSPEVVHKFTSKQFKGNRRGLGWDKPERTKKSSPTSPFASAAAFGHSGFTGTVVWVDPTFNLIFVFLSNRVHPYGNNRKLNRFNVRRRIHDLVYESMWNFEKFNN
jgi:CubicO group peptidase (beta-lactamase class C family)